MNTGGQLLLALLAAALIGAAVVWATLKVVSDPSAPALAPIELEVPEALQELERRGGWVGDDLQGGPHDRGA
ncbi:MAG: hypothetical protein MSC31_07040, partial [Solirubrobacteraceae bacterium MAG38_C4-C5]|nr:hypothetical protein [Candidatus Siliceabacter maunaloa]